MIFLSIAIFLVLPLAELTQSHIWWILVWLCIFGPSRWREWTIWVLIEKCVLAYGIIINGEGCLKKRDKFHCNWIKCIERRTTMLIMPNVLHIPLFSLTYVSCTVLTIFTRWYNFQSATGFLFGLRFFFWSPTKKSFSSARWCLSRANRTRQLKELFLLPCRRNNHNFVKGFKFQLYHLNVPKETYLSILISH